MIVSIYFFSKTYKEHLEGQKHKKREQAAKSSEQQKMETNDTANNSNGASNQNMNRRQLNENRYNRNNLVIRCELCDVACTGRDAYAAHLRGMKHQKVIIYI